MALFCLPWDGNQQPLPTDIEKSPRSTACVHHLSLHIRFYEVSTSAWLNLNGSFLMGPQGKRRQCRKAAKRTSSGIRQTWIQIPDLPVISCAPSRKWAGEAAVLHQEHPCPLHGRWKPEAEWDNSEHRWDNRGKEWASSPSEGIIKDWKGKAHQRTETRLPKLLQKLRDHNGNLSRRRQKIRGMPAEGRVVTEGRNPQRTRACLSVSRPAAQRGLHPREALVLFWSPGMYWCLWLSDSCHPLNSRN